MFLYEHYSFLDFISIIKKNQEIFGAAKKNDQIWPSMADHEEKENQSVWFVHPLQCEPISNQPTEK